MLALGNRLGQIFFRLQNSKFRDKAIFSIPRATPGNSYLKSYLVVFKLVMLSGVHQLDYRWQQMYEQIIHDVTSVKYNQENNIFSH